MHGRHSFQLLHSHGHKVELTLGFVAITVNLQCCINTTVTGATSIMVTVTVRTRAYEGNSIKRIPVQTNVVCKKELGKA